MSDLTDAPYEPYEVKLALKPRGLAGLSVKLLEQHWSLYEGYVANVNALNKAIRESRRALSTPAVAELVRRLGYEYNGMILHEYYFGALARGSSFPPPSSNLARRFARDFGSFENWRRQFAEIGRMRGVGWVIASVDPMSRRLLNFWVSDHETGHAAGFIPIVVMDMWEHAYALDYGAKADGRAAYIETYFKNLDWGAIEDRLALADQGKVRPRDMTPSVV